MEKETVASQTHLELACPLNQNCVRVEGSVLAMLACVLEKGIKWTSLTQGSSRQHHPEGYWAPGVEPFSVAAMTGERSLLEPSGWGPRCQAACNGWARPGDKGLPSSPPWGEKSFLHISPPRPLLSIYKCKLPLFTIFTFTEISGNTTTM